MSPAQVFVRIPGSHHPDTRLRLVPGFRDPGSVLILGQVTQYGNPYLICITMSYRNMPINKQSRGCCQVVATCDHQHSFGVGRCRGSKEVDAQIATIIIAFNIGHATNVSLYIIFWLSAVHIKPYPTVRNINLSTTDIKCQYHTPTPDTIRLTNTVNNTRI